MIQNEKQNLAAKLSVLTLLFVFVVTPTLSVFATTPNLLTGTVVVTSSTLINTYTKDSKTFFVYADQFTYTGDISGVCTGTDTSNNVGGPGDSFGTFTGSCTLVGTVGGVSGTMVILFRSPVGAESTADAKLNFLYSGGSGTGNLASAHIENGKVAFPSNQYTASVQFG